MIEEDDDEYQLDSADLDILLESELDSIPSNNGDSEILFDNFDVANNKAVSYAIEDNKDDWAELINYTSNFCEYIQTNIIPSSDSQEGNGHGPNLVSEQNIEEIVNSFATFSSGNDDNLDSEVRQLMDMMIEAVECSAPIFSSNSSVSIENLSTVDGPRLYIIDDDNLELQHNEASSNFEHQQQQRQQIHEETENEMMLLASVYKEREIEEALNLEEQLKKELEDSLEEDRRRRQDRRLRFEQEAAFAIVQKNMTIRIQNAFRIHSAKQCLKRRKVEADQKKAEELRLLELEKQYERKREDEERNCMCGEDFECHLTWDRIKQEELEKQRQHLAMLVLQEQLRIQSERAREEREHNQATAEDDRSLQLRGYQKYLQRLEIERLQQEETARKKQQEMEAKEELERQIRLKAEMEMNRREIEEFKNQEVDQLHDESKIINPSINFDRIPTCKNSSNVPISSKVNGWGGVFSPQATMNSGNEKNIMDETYCGSSGEECNYDFTYDSGSESPCENDDRNGAHLLFAAAISDCSVVLKPEVVSTVLKNLYSNRSVGQMRKESQMISHNFVKKGFSVPNSHVSQESSQLKSLEMSVSSMSSYFHLRNNFPDSKWYHPNYITDVENLTMRSLLQWRELHNHANENVRFEKLTSLTPLKRKEKVVSVKGELDMLNTDATIVTDLNISVEGIEDVSFLKDFVRLSSLSLNVNKISDLSSLEAMMRNREGISKVDGGLASLSVKDNRLTDISPLKTLRGLTNLYLDSNRISDLSAVSGLNLLRNFSVSNNQITRISSSYFSHCESLQRLELFRNQIVSVDDNCFSLLPSLTHLDLGNNKLRALNGSSLSSGCPLLQTLILSQNELTEPPNPLRLPLLKNLWLNGNRIDKLSAWLPVTVGQKLTPKASVEMLFPVFLPSLQKLFIQDNQLRQLDRHCLSCCPLLQELDLSFNSLQSIADIHYAIRQTGESLRVIHVQDNPLMEGQLHNSDIFHDESSSSDSEGSGGEHEAPSRRRPNAVSKKELIVQQLLRVCPKLETICGNEVTKEDRAKALLARARKARKSGDVFTAKYRKFLQMMKLFQVQQYSLLSKSKLRKKPDNLDSSEVDWELAFVQLLVKQWKEILSFAKESTTSEWFVPFSGTHSNNNQLPVAVEAMWDSGSDDDVAVNDQTKKFASLLQTGPAGNFAVTSLQRHFRGRKVRKRLSTIIGSIRYEDSELDELMGLQMVDYNSWLQVDDEPSQPMVYGDHIRKRAAKLPASSTVASNGGWQAAKESYSYGVQSHINHDESRPSTTLTTNSDVSSHSFISSRTVQGASNEMEDREKAVFHGNGKVGDQVDEDWSLSDPKVVGALAKRRAKIIGFEKAKEAREAEKDPQFRYEKFLKSAQRGHPKAVAVPASGTNPSSNTSNTSTSGSFGGRPKTLRRLAAAKAKTGVNVPAWMNKEEDDS